MSVDPDYEALAKSTSIAVEAVREFAETAQKFAAPDTKPAPFLAGGTAQRKERRATERAQAKADRRAAA